MTSFSTLFKTHLTDVSPLVGLSPLLFNYRWLQNWLNGAAVADVVHITTGVKKVQCSTSGTWIRLSAFRTAFLHMRFRGQTAMGNLGRLVALAAAAGKEDHGAFIFGAVASFSFLPERQRRLHHGRRSRV